MCVRSWTESSRLAWDTSMPTWSLSMTGWCWSTPGLPGRAAKVEQALQEIRKKVGEVHTVLLTHRHPDHVGGVAELRRRSGARVVAHAADAPIAHRSYEVGLRSHDAGPLRFACGGGRDGRVPPPRRRRRCLAQ